MSDPDTQVDDIDLEAASPDTTVPVSVVRKIRNNAREKQQNLERELAELRGTVEGLKAGAAKPAATETAPQRTFTRAQLDAAVAEGRLSQEAADATWESQIERRAEVAAERRIDEKDAARTVNAEIDRYTAANPEIKVVGSPARERVKEQFKKLIARGHADDSRTELLALETVFGPVEGLKRKDGARETHQETGGTGGSGAGTATGGAPKDLAPRLRDFYARQIDKGLYTGWDDKELKAEIAYARPRQSRAA